jgi:hypothetical protein
MAGFQPAGVCHTALAGGALATSVFLEIYIPFSRLSAGLGSFAKPS